MTAPVIDLASHRRNREQTGRADCRACRPDSPCYPHRLVMVADLLRADLAATEELLLVSRETFAAAVEAVLPTLDGIVRECGLEDERPAR